MQTHHATGGHISGLRRISPALRRSEDYALQWVGLPQGASKGGLLRLLEDVPAARMGLSLRARNFLHRLVKMQPAECFKSATALVGCDMSKAALALVSTYSDVTLTAELDVTSRSLARWRDQANVAGWISFRDSADRTRYRVGTADAPEDAYGIDLRPLIARYRELERLRDQAVADRHEFKAVQHTLSRSRNRLRSLQALVVTDAPLAFLDTALNTIEAVRRGKDLDHARMALSVVADAITQLESFLDTNAAAICGLTQASPAPDTIGAQLLPTSPIQIDNSSIGGREAIREKGAASTAHSPSCIATTQDDEDEEVVWQSSDLDDEGETGPVIEVDARSVAAVRPRRYLPRVNTPDVGEVIASLPAILATKDFPFTRHPMFPTDLSLSIAYGKSAAGRVGLTNEEITRHAEGENAFAFAVASLLAEFTEGVVNRRAYLLGLVRRINDPAIVVDLWASWQRIKRTSQHSSRA